MLCREGPCLNSGALALQQITLNFCLVAPISQGTSVCIFLFWSVFYYSEGKFCVKLAIIKRRINSKKIYLSILLRAS